LPDSQRTSVSRRSTLEPVPLELLLEEELLLDDDELLDDEELLLLDEEDESGHGQTWPIRKTAHFLPYPDSRQSTWAAPSSLISKHDGSPSRTSAQQSSGSSGSIQTRPTVTPLTTARPMPPERSGSSRITNRPRKLVYGDTPVSSTRFWNCCRSSPGSTTGPPMPSTSKRSRSPPESLRTLTMPL
jgi:hypothetical protein